MDSHRIALAVPALPEFLRVVRVTASGLASRLGFGIDDVDDLRLALDELCFAIIGKGVEGEDLKLAYTLTGDQLVIEGTVQGSDLSNREENELSSLILTALVDDHRIWDGDGAGHFRLEKRRTEVA